MIGWKTVERRDGSFFGVGIDGRRWDKPLIDYDGSRPPVALLRQPGTDAYLPVTTRGTGRMRRLLALGPDGIRPRLPHFKTLNQTMPTAR